MLRDANLVIRSFDGSEDLPVGKMVNYRGYWIVHCFVYGKYRRISQGAWGVRAPVAQLMAEEGIDHLYFLDNGGGVTWSTTLSQVRSYGVLGQPDQFGGTINLPEERWSKRDGRMKLTWVPDQDQRVLAAVAEPWPMPKPAQPKTAQPVRPEKPAPKPPAGETLAMEF